MQNLNIVAGKKILPRHIGQIISDHAMDLIPIDNLKQRQRVKFRVIDQQHRLAGVVNGLAIEIGAFDIGRGQAEFHIHAISADEADIAAQLS